MTCTRTAHLSFHVVSVPCQCFPRLLWGARAETSHRNSCASGADIPPTEPELALAPDSELGLIRDIGFGFGFAEFPRHYSIVSQKCRTGTESDNAEMPGGDRERHRTEGGGHEI
ncbi:hypothetical protein DFH94DRAFT_678684 [Russula ochroleuca]|uniref:Uncharacterized protein n=1 Tax=Russula ochroleuca TaxID=152965 RepID=A0A9P5JVA1_9AGAM|nr:hypothetical protein DFH94DRAFT_686852 [Russula ochroleuca]KAF8485890.1 hypothetical protein DFH94DRAFT_678684 [Russula ochroleuca]